MHPPTHPPTHTHSRTRVRTHPRRSNAKALWVAQRPMNDEELLQQQVIMSTSASLGQSVWVYRGSMWAYPWYTSVRKTLEDPAYADWYVPFKPVGPWYSDKCDRNYDPPLCSDRYHNQEQSPGYPSGDGNCPAPNCNCGSVPCGFYFVREEVVCSDRGGVERCRQRAWRGAGVRRGAVAGGSEWCKERCKDATQTLTPLTYLHRRPPQWNHSSTTVVNGQSFLDWFKDTCVGGNLCATQ